MPEPDAPYIPIDCGVHDRLLAFATLRQECELTYAAGDGLRRARGIIVDVYSRNGAEYLEMGNGPTIRLDELRAIDGEPIAAPHA